MLGRAHRLVGQPQAHHRVALVDVQRHAEHSDAVAVGAHLLLAAHRHRHLGDQWTVGKLVVLQQPPAQRAGADRQDDVVDGAVMLVLDALDRFQRELPEGEPAMGRDASVEGGLRCGQIGPLQHPLLSPADQPRHPRGGATDGMHPRYLGEEGHVLHVGNGRREGANHPLDVAGRPQHPAEQHLQLARLTLRAGCPRRLVLLRGLGTEVQKHPHDLRAGHAVDHGVVDLRQQRHVATAQPVDEVGLPQGA